jgi:hypothetical protein
MCYVHAQQVPATQPTATSTGPKKEKKATTRAGRKHKGVGYNCRPCRVIQAIEVPSTAQHKLSCPNLEEHKKRYPKDYKKTPKKGPSHTTIPPPTAPTTMPQSHTQSPPTPHGSTGASTLGAETTPTLNPTEGDGDSFTPTSSMNTQATMCMYSNSFLGPTIERLALIQRHVVANEHITHNTTQ